MKILDVKEIIRQIGGELIQGRGDHTVRNAVSHPKRLEDQTVLFDLNHNSYKFVKQLKRYPRTVIVTENPQHYLRLDKWTIIYVPNIEEAFWSFIRFYRGLWDLPVIGVTGTCGKTTVKEMITHILKKASLQVQSTYKSMNSLEKNLSYLVGINEHTEAAVIEMGVACPDDLLYSCQCFQPQIGVITTIGIDHLQHCGTQENYIREKAKLLKGLRNQGTLIINADCPNIAKIDMSSYRGKIIRFGLKGNGDFHARDIRYVRKGMAFTLSMEDKVHEAFVPGYGEHTVANALAALAAVNSIGIEIEKAIEWLSSFKHVESHLEIHHGLNGCIVIDDTWSSNPTSVEAALKVLTEISGEKKTVALLGEMKLLGDHTNIQHALVGEKVVQYGVDVLVTIDKTTNLIGRQAAKLGMPQNQIFRCESAEQAYTLLNQLLDKQTVILIKTSMLDPRTEIIKRILLRGSTTNERT